MLNLLVITIGVALGTMLASVLMLVVMLTSPRFIKAVIRRYMKVCRETAEEILKEDYDV